MSDVAIKTQDAGSKEVEAHVSFQEMRHYDEKIEDVKISPHSAYLHRS